MLLVQASLITRYYMYEHKLFTKRLQFMTSEMSVLFVVQTILLIF